MTDMGPRIDAAAAVIAAAGGSPDPNPDPDPDPTPGLAPPSNLQASAALTEIYLSWDAVASASGYNAYYGMSPDEDSGWFRLTTDGPVSGTELVVTGAQAGVTYYFAVTAVASAKESAMSNVAQATPGGESGGLDSPRNVSATPGNSTAGLSWTPPTTTNLAGYHVYGGLTPNLTYADRLTWWPITYTSATVYNLENGVTYYFAVTAVDSYWQESALSNVVSVTPGGSSGGGDDPWPDPDPRS